MLRRPGISILAVLAVVFGKSLADESTFSDFSKYAQPNDLALGSYDDYLTNENNSSLCLRSCQPGKSKICYYKFHVEQFSVLNQACGQCPQVREDCFKPQCVTADGYERAILTANRQLPGPSIQVCEGDLVIVDVINQLPGKSTSIHWHGQHQRNTPWMDGVPMITQCPILAGETFRYYFRVYGPGTYYWHSHEGLQKVDGLEGSLIVREPDSENILSDQYGFDLPSHNLFVQDWLNTLADDRLPGQKTINVGQSPNSYIINGRGVQQAYLANGSLPANQTTPMAVFHVTQGNRYRFRFIAASCLSCPFSVTFQNHKLTVINIDGDNPVEPVVVDKVHMASGERYDMVVTASNQIAAYWIIVSGLGSECQNVHQLAILCYEGATCEPDLPISSAINGFSGGYVLNPYVSNCTNETLSSEICVSQLQSKVPVPKQIRGVPDIFITIPFGFHDFTDKELFESGTYRNYFVPEAPPPTTSLLQNVSSKTPPVPLLTQYNEIPPSMFCKPSTCKRAASVCDCINVNEVQKNKLIEVMLIDSSPPDYSLNLSHPFHIHGYDFYIMEQGIYNYVEGQDPSSILPAFVASQQRKSAEGQTINRFVPSKDTVVVTTGGYARFRIYSDNPGFWYFHCHYAYHLETGMLLTFQVGSLSQMKKPPPNFPHCNQFVPSLDQILKWEYH